MSLKEILVKEPKAIVYDYYKRIIKKPKSYDNITRIEMYEEIISTFKNTTEIILDMCTVEEIDALEKLLNEEDLHDDHGFLEYLIVKNLAHNYLIYKSDNKYYIPKDIINYVKMAFNIYDPESGNFKDVTESLILGLVRIYNAVEITEFSNILASYHINIIPKDIRTFIKNNIRLKDKVSVVKYAKKSFIISLEYYHYKDIINTQSNLYKRKEYSLESVISIGKYYLNLFDEKILNLLDFLESHLEPIYVETIIHNLVIYVGFDLKSNFVLKNIANNITELYEELKKALDSFPIWIYKGNTNRSLNSNIILPDKNALCFCGSGKKFKDCCRKYYK